MVTHPYLSGIANLLTIAVYTPKGGEGKSFITKLLLAEFAKRGKRGLGIDLDGTGSLTEGVGLEDAYEQAGSSLHDKLLYPDRVNARDLIWEVPGCNFWIIPSEVRMKKISDKLVSERNKEFRLARALQDIAGDFDVVVIDTPPSDNVITDNAIVASRRLIIPVAPKDESLRALFQTFDQIDRLRDDMQIFIDILAVVPNRFKGTKNQKKVLNDVRQLGEMVIPFEIRERDVISEMFTTHTTIYTYEPPKDESHKWEYINDLKGYSEQLVDFVEGRIKELP